ncbi:unnamed protein product [Zymoseptoria tritici ST99CH_1E4]|uniref:Long-chain-alcohol oxidase n=1 Tax=Zymoseptoria tritici ST99CH_1E4 TaxID=1276532 RepID=A0A2H1FZ94_ZYMTR|nr:unnamed protein product [Zymoseptoria tritici ST99CH_1E4]
MSIQSVAVEQTKTPLPPAPEGVLNTAQWSIFSAIATTIVPSIAQSAQGNRLLQLPVRKELYNPAVSRIANLCPENDAGLITAYLGESATTSPQFQEHVFRLINNHMSETDRNGLLFILNALNTRAGSLLLTGHATTIDCLPIRDREQIILGWARSRIPLLRGLHRSLTSLSRAYWMRTSSTLPRLLAHPNTPIDAALPNAGFEFRFIQIPPSAPEDVEVIETDVVIVGSGCGGAVVAKILAEAGLRVIVVEKSYYWSPEYLPMTEADAPYLLFGNGGGHISNDSTMTVVPGQTWGGGGVVNWSASLQPQGFVRREWSEKFGLKHFTTSAFQADLDAVCERMGVGLTNVKHNKANTVLMEGARKLGWSAKPVPQNTGGELHPDGYCTRGCRSCGKKGPTVTFLPDAAKCGARFIEGFDVQEILFGATTPDGTKQTTGIKGIWTSRDGHGGVAGPDVTRRQLIINARRTIISGGSVYTPILLSRSGLKNRHIGRHLRLHPVAMLGAVWDEDVRPWEGAILTSVCNEFENLDGEGYGAKLEATTMMPSSFLPLFPWTGGLQFKEFTAKMRRMTGYIALARDRYGGRVFPDPKEPGRAIIQYHPSKYDKQHILAGLVGLAEIMYVEGAREIFATIPGLEPFVRPSSDAAANISVHSTASPSVSDEAFQSWLHKLKTIGFPYPDTGFISAHQMGSCRMGSSKHNSVVDGKGKVWGAEGLYVADASVFPSASGVNPMITVMGIARGIARGIVEEEGLVLGGGEGRARL